VGRGFSRDIKNDSLTNLPFGGFFVELSFLSIGNQHGSNKLSSEAGGEYFRI
jgi:hypothetical protein